MDKLRETWEKMYTGQLNESQRDDGKKVNNPNDKLKPGKDGGADKNDGKVAKPGANPETLEDQEWTEINAALVKGELSASTISKLKKIVKK